MKYLILLLLAIPAHALDLNLPETAFDYEQIEEDSLRIQNAINNRLRILNIEKEPSKSTLRTFYILNAVDMSTSYYFTRNHPYIKEGNFFLPSKPTAAEFLMHKSITAPFAAANLDDNQLVLVNWITALVIIHNVVLYKTTCKNHINYHHVTGQNINSC